MLTVLEQFIKGDYFISILLSFKKFIYYYYVYYYFDSFSDKDIFKSGFGQSVIEMEQVGNDFRCQNLAHIICRSSHETNQVVLSMR